MQFESKTKKKTIFLHIERLRSMLQQQFHNRFLITSHSQNNRQHAIMTNQQHKFNSKKKNFFKNLNFFITYLGKCTQPGAAAINSATTSARPPAAARCNAVSPDASTSPTNVEPHCRHSVLTSRRMSLSCERVCAPTKLQSNHTSNIVKNTRKQ